MPPHPHADFLPPPLRRQCLLAAWHEAGHAVMRSLIALPLGPVFIRPDGTGRCDPPTPGAHIDPESSLYIELAGPVAESWRTEGRSLTLVALRIMGPGDDLEEAARSIARIDRRGWLDGPWEHRARRDLRIGRHTEITTHHLAELWYLRDTRRILKAARADVERVAQALLARWHLSGPEVQSLILSPPVVQDGMWVDR